jgi:hypothetical protein
VPRAPEALLEMRQEDRDRPDVGHGQLLRPNLLTVARLRSVGRSLVGPRSGIARRLGARSRGGVAWYCKVLQMLMPDDGASVVSGSCASAKNTGGAHPA